MALDPWSYADKTKTEHAEQVALFMWANMAERYGVIIADDPHSYTVRDFAKTQAAHAGELGYKRFSPSLVQLKWLHAIHNQGHGDAIRGNKAKAEGVKAGVADVFLPYPMVAFRTDRSMWRNDRGLYIELKRKNGTHRDLSDDQQDFLKDVIHLGYRAVVAFGWEHARTEILNYLGVKI